jgi:hypothetical protein
MQQTPRGRDKHRIRWLSSSGHREAKGAAPCPTAARHHAIVGREPDPGGMRPWTQADLALRRITVRDELTRG